MEADPKGYSENSNIQWDLLHIFNKSISNLTAIFNIDYLGMICGQTICWELFTKTSQQVIANDK